MPFPNVSKPKSKQAIETERLIEALKENESFSPAPPKLVK
jgi:hypothetical protein